jgi:hypothetical protein
MAPVFAILGTVVSAIGTIAGAAASARQANAQAAAENHAALVADQKAMQERAVGQRQSFEKRREARFAQSTLLARAAASGGSATDPTIVKLGSDIAERTEYMALSDMARGEQAGLDYENKADLSRWKAGIMRDEAKMAMTGGIIGAGSTILSGASSIFGKMAGAGSGGFVGLQPQTAQISTSGLNGGLFENERRRDFWSQYYG